MPLPNKRQKLIKEYNDFKKDADHMFNEIPHQFILFGSLKTNKIAPRDIDVHIDVGQLSKDQATKLNHNIKSLTTKYKHVDIMVWMFKKKRLPIYTNRSKLRWKDNQWKTLNKNAKYRIMKNI